MTCPSPLLPLRYPFRVKSTTTSFVYAFALVSSLNRYRRRLHPPIRAAGCHSRSVSGIESATSSRKRKISLRRSKRCGVMSSPLPHCPRYPRHRAMLPSPSEKPVFSTGSAPPQRIPFGQPDFSTGSAPPPSLKLGVSDRSPPSQPCLSYRYSVHPQPSSLAVGYG